MAVVLPRIPDDMWPIHLRPQLGELLSSWMVRLAHAHGMRAESMCTALFGRGAPLWNRDIDRAVSPAQLERLSRVSANDSADLFDCTLLSLAGVVCEEVTVHGNSPAIVPQGVYHRTRRRRSLMFCPECLKTDEHPHYRKAWRLSHVSVCGVHALQLLDGCPRCGAPLIPHRVDIKWRLRTTVGSSLHACCFNCCFDLRWAQAPSAADDELAASALVERVLKDGGIDMGTCVAHSIAFFRGLTALTSALPHPSGWDGLDMASLQTRRELVSRACALLAHWPARFLAHAAQHNWTAVDLIKPRQQLPYWLDQVVQQNLHQGRALVTQGEAQSIVEQVYLKTGRFDLAVARQSSGRMIELRHLGARYASSASEDSFETLLGYIDHLIARQSNPVERAHLFSDKVMLALAWVHGYTQVRLAALSLDGAKGLASRRRPDFWKAPRTPQDVSAWLGWYLREVRPRLRPAPDVSALFVCRFSGRPLGASAIGERFRAHMRDSMLQRQIANFSWLGRAAALRRRSACGGNGS